MDKIIVREDLNIIVKGINLKKIKNKFGERNVCVVTLFNDEVIEFKDNENLYELFQSYIKCGEADFIKSKELVEEVRKDEEENEIGTYICVKFTLKDESVYRLFVSKFNSNKIIDNYYKLYKNSKKVESPKK